MVDSATAVRAKSHSRCDEYSLIISEILGSATAAKAQSREAFNAPIFNMVSTNTIATVTKSGTNAAHYHATSPVIGFNAALSGNTLLASACSLIRR